MNKKGLLPALLIAASSFYTTISVAQCSICTKTAQQLGEGPAHSLNVGILYLMFAPLAIMGYIGFKWWKKEKEIMKNEA